jgi:hypothetical protein
MQHSTWRSATWQLLTIGIIAGCGTIENPNPTPTPTPTPACTPVLVYADHDGNGVGAGDPSTACVDDPAQLPPGMARTGGDCDDELASVTSPIAGYADADGDRVTTGPAVMFCLPALPAGFRAAANGDDCNDHDATISQPGTFYVDSDGDHYGAPNSATSLCATQPPAGFALDGSDPDDHNAAITPLDVDGDLVSDANDCAPTDASRWSLATVYVDADGDYYSTGVSQTMCIGATAPAGYSLGSVGIDCNDGDPSVNYPLTGFVDADHDGAGGGPGVSLCVASLPAGYTPTATDCDDSDPSLQTEIYGWRDADGDGYGAALGGAYFCAASLPAGYVRRPFDNDDGDPTVNMRLVRIAVYHGANETCGSGGCRGSVQVSLASGGDYVWLVLSAYDFTDWQLVGATMRVGKVSVVDYSGATVGGPLYTSDVSYCIYTNGCGNGNLPYDVYEQGLFTVQ